MSGCSLANENDEVRAATCSSLILESELSSSSVSPSEKYSCSLSPLMFTNGSTATECGGGLKAAAVAGAGAAGWVVGAVDDGERLESKNLSTAIAASATATTAPIAHSPGLDRQGDATDPPDTGPAEVGNIGAAAACVDDA